MFSTRRLGGVLPLGVAAAVGLVGPPARATAVTLADAFIQLNDSGFNDIGMPVGNYIFIGGDISPAGPSTTALASTINTVTGAPLLVSVPFEGSVSAPNFYSTEVVDNAGLHGSWTLSSVRGLCESFELVAERWPERLKRLDRL